MKKLICMMLALGAFYVTQAQSSTTTTKTTTTETTVTDRDVPGTVVTTFKTAYPSVSEVRWVHVGPNYEAEYNTNGEEMYVTYDPSGSIIESGQGVTTTVLPSSATTYVKTKYNGDKITKVYKIKDSKGVVMYKGRVKNTNLVFDENGNFIREERR